jgi:two-component system chemotaxis sensor kinase CheA
VELASSVAPVEVVQATEPAAADPVAPEPAPPESHHDVVGDQQADHDAKPTEGAGAAPSGGGIRVDVGLLDRLMNLVGELVLARNQILQFSATIDNATLAGSTQRLNLITTELQEGVMKTRMQPIGNVWSKFPRVVRDVSQMCGKKVRVEMEGKETELDKTIIEAIKDPLTHIIRNSVDHGVETPEKRRAIGKPEEGRLFLRAFHEGGQVNIEIIDDGAGISTDRVKKKAVEKGLITPEQAARMGDREAINLIWLPGFSTAEKVTNVSGRGVGMDVVKTNIEKIGGIVDMTSKQGEGTTLRIKIPLTLAIIPALIITSGGDRFAIPQVSLLELVRLENGQDGTGIELIRNTPVYRLRGNLLPLVYLDKELGTAPAEAPARDAVNIVVLQADDRQFGLVVDVINDTEEIVVKPLAKLFKGLTTFAGATIMGDGKVALILDVMGLAQRANVVSESKDHGRHDEEESDRAENNGVAKQTLLLFHVSQSRRMGIPLSLVSRLEEFNRDILEQSGDQQVVQYRGQIMPLISLSEALLSSRIRLQRQAEAEQTPKVQVIVYTRNGHSIGLVVDRIVDIVEQTIEIQKQHIRPGVLGSAVIEKKVTELLDVEAVIAEALSQRDPSDSPKVAA